MESIVFLIFGMMVRRLHDLHEEQRHCECGYSARLGWVAVYGIVVLFLSRSILYSLLPPL